MKVILTMAEGRTKGGKQNLTTARMKSGRQAAPIYWFAPTGASAGQSLASDFAQIKPWQIKTWPK
jgi:hypothetical protein